MNLQKENSVLFGIGGSLFTYAIPWAMYHLGSVFAMGSLFCTWGYSI